MTAGPDPHARASTPTPDPPPMLRFLDHTDGAIARDLAIDEALLLDAEGRGAGPVLRVWEPELAVVLGASGRTSEDVEVGRCRADGVPIARRSSGGGTVLVGPGALNVTVVLPADFAPGLDAVDASQRYVLERFAGAIRRRGPRVEVLGHGDLTIDGRKFAGSAQRRLRRHFLVHVSLLWGMSPETVARYLRPPKRQPAYREGRPHESFLTTAGLGRDELRAAVLDAWPPSADPPELATFPEDLVRRLVTEKFADPAWIERL